MRDYSKEFLIENIYIIVDKEYKNYKEKILNKYLIIDFDDNDILIFTNSYEQHVLENPLLNSKIPIWVEFLKNRL